MFTNIKNVKMPDCEGNFNILSAGGKIVEISNNDCYSFKNMKVFDAEGLIAVPGFIDQHVHITGGGGEGGFSNRVPELIPSDCIKGGVTTLVGLLGTDSETRSVENLVAKTKALKEYGLTAFCLTGAYKYPAPTITNSVEKDIVFIEEIIGVKTAISDHRSSALTKEELTKLATEARRGGILSGKPGIVTIHTGTGKGGLTPIFDVLDSTDIPISNFRPTHVQRVFDDAVEFAKRGGYIDFTSDENAKEPAQYIKKALTLVPNELITLSSDSNGSMPIWNDKKEMIGITKGKITTLYKTIKSLVLDFGVPLSEAIKPITENVAKALSIFPNKGTLKEGSDADIVFLDNELNIDTVICGGEIMMEHKRILKKDKFETN